MSRAEKRVLGNHDPLVVAGAAADEERAIAYVPRWGADRWPAGTAARALRHEQGASRRDCAAHRRGEPREGARVSKG